MTEPRTLAPYDPFLTESSGLGPNLAFLFAYDLARMATGGDGSVGNPWTGFETAFNALAANSNVHARAGYYTRVTRMEMKLGQTLFGDGKEATIIQSSDAGTSIRIDAVPSNPFAVLQHGHVTIRDLQILNTNVANTGSGIIAVAVSYCDFSTVKVVGHRIGVAYLACINMKLGGPSYFASQITAGAWLVNDGSYKPANGFDLDYSGCPTGGTNCIEISGETMFNESATCYGIVDDGGNGRNLIVGFNGCLTALRLASTSEVVAQFHSEACAGEVVVLDFQRLFGGAGGGASVHLHDCYIAPTGVNACIGVNSAVNVLLEMCTFNTTHLAIRNGAGINRLVNVLSTVTAAALLASFPTHYFSTGTDSGGDKVAIAGLPVALPSSAGATRIGTSVLVAGSVTVANTSVTANTVVVPIRQIVGGAAGALGYTINPGVGFTITSASGTDTSTVDWFLIEKG